MAGNKRTYNYASPPDYHVGQFVSVFVHGEGANEITINSFADRYALIAGLGVPGAFYWPFQSYSYILASANFDYSNHFELLAAGKIMNTLRSITAHHHHHANDTMRGTVML